MERPAREGYSSAVKDFREARRRADMEQVIARLQGKSNDLLCYGDVRELVGVKDTSDRELREIPLDAIVGSVGRCTDFTRTFLPRRDSDGQRWARVQIGASEQRGLPPIEVYQIGDVYFVQDGNHRVSIARQKGAVSIPAYVIEVHTRVPLSPDTQPDDLILKAEYADFLERTCLGELRPQADLSVSVPGQYPALQEHIAVHRHFMGLEQKREIPYDEAVAHWYDEVYLPTAQVIRERGTLRDFPGRTEADLYLWVSEHRAELEQELGWDVRPEEAAADLAAQFSPRRRRVVARVSSKIRDAVKPDELDAGPPPGEWRKERLATRRDDRLFADILVAINGEGTGWHALDQALEVARREDARLHGLHVVPSETQQSGEEARAVQTEFDRRCKEAGIPAELAVAVGKVSREICDRARWADLIVLLSLSSPPSPQPVARLGSGLSTLLRRCPRPVLAVPDAPSNLQSALLAYDGSPKADEALFIATYLAGQWRMSLTVVTIVEHEGTTSEVLHRAQSYLEAHGVQAAFVQKTGPAAEAILKAADPTTGSGHGEQKSDLIILGGYRLSPVLEVLLGSTLDEVLRARRWPLLICR